MFTWDPKWNQNSLKSQNVLKNRSIYMAILPRQLSKTFSKILLHMRKWQQIIIAMLIDAKQMLQYWLFFQQ